MRGMNRLRGHPIDHKWNPELFMKAVNELRDVVSDELAIDLCAQDLQNCLCEVDKYIRALEGGRPKQNYNGHGRHTR
jgi:hypothetical protein